MSRLIQHTDSRLTRLKLKFDARAIERNKPKPVSILFSDKTHYWKPDSLPFAYCIACVQQVLELNPTIRPLYIEIIRDWGLPGLQAAGHELIASFDLDETKRGCPNLNNIEARYSDNQDFEHLINRVAMFIKVGFNRIEDQANEVWKVLPSTDTQLFNAVCALTLGENLGIKLEDWNQYKPLVRDGKTYDTEDIMANKPTPRVHRGIVSLLKHYGKIVHDEKLLKKAGQWYKCRVNPGSIEAYINELVDGGITSPNHPADQGRISNDIAACDDATGYPRHK